MADRGRFRPGFRLFADRQFTSLACARLASARRLDRHACNSRMISSRVIDSALPMKFPRSPCVLRLMYRSAGRSYRRTATISAAFTVRAPVGSLWYFPTVGDGTLPQSLELKVQSASRRAGWLSARSDGQTGAYWTRSTIRSSAVRCRGHGNSNISQGRLDGDWRRRARLQRNHLGRGRPHLGSGRVDH